MTTFDTLGLSNQTLKTLSSLGYEQPTPIQAQAIPLVLAGHDLIGLAQTGTGKTAAFGLPIIEKLLAEGGRQAPRKRVRTLILAPTRELVNQIAANLSELRPQARRSSRHGRRRRLDQQAAEELGAAWTSSFQRPAACST